MSSAETEVKPVPETKEPIQQPHDSVDEEYESADDAYEEEIEEIEVEEEVEVEDEEEYDEEGRSPVLKDADKELDDDEDVKNPQFIPKRGYFYEHDDRTKEEDEEPEEESKKDQKMKPTKVPDRWTHDLFNADEQKPKSKDELAKAYGYDIWTEDQAPRARRRRRYGRGPNKYTRRWEEEEAYQKPRGGFRGRGGRGGRGRGGFRGGPPDRRSSDTAHPKDHDEEFPALPGSEATASRSSQLPSKPAAFKGERKEFPDTKREFPDTRREFPDTRKEFHDTRGQQDHRRSDDSAFQRGSGAPRGRGRRNEFSNRNRYPNRRGSDDYRENQPPPGEPRPSNQGSSRGPPQFHQQPNGHMRDTRSRDGPLPSKPPFTNTEYTGSHSLTANRSGTQAKKSNILEEKGVTDLREILNAKRQQQQQQQQPHPSQQREQQKSERKAQAPPRQQHQEPKVEPKPRRAQSPRGEQHHQQPVRHYQAVHDQQHPPQPLAAEHSLSPTGKPKKFSQRRQGQEQPQMVTSTGGVIPTSGAVPMSHVPPNMIPVVTGADQMVPPPVPAYPQASYYEGPQVFEGSGSPVTVATVSANGTSVSPSLWTPHAYAANAPYPSPPTGPQVPPAAAYAEHPAYLAQQGGPIYQGPPQFIQDPSMINYNTAAPPFTPTFHPPAGYQGYPTPPPPPEMYHGGVTYYNPQPQIQRQPLMPQKRGKALQLVEPPERTRGGRSNYKDPQEHQSQSQSPPAAYADPVSQGHPAEHSELPQQVERLSLAEPKSEQPVEQIRKPSPVPEQKSWSAEMEEAGDSPENSMPPEKTELKDTSDKPSDSKNESE